MNIARRAPFLLVAWLTVAAIFSGCMMSVAEVQIRERIASIRSAILAKRAEGIVEFGTPDWSFRTADGKAFDRAAYLARVEKLFAEVEIESLDTKVERVFAGNGRAEVELVQTMVRTEPEGAGARTRWKVSYREHQEWVRSPTRGWLVVSVQVYNSTREKLPPR